MARKKKVEVVPPTPEEVQQAVIEGVIETVQILHALFQSLESNGRVIQASLKGAVDGYLGALVEQKMVALFNVVCDESNNYEDDEVPFLEVNFGFDPDDFENYISVAFGSDEAVAEWQEANPEDEEEDDE
jgi:hypothetical protein